MIALKLARLSDTGQATFGQLFDSDGKQLFVTLERAWRNNERGVSCVPPGQYVARRRWSTSHNCDLFGLVDVPDRSDIELHWGSFARDTEGCILLGTRFAVIEGQHAIKESQAAFSRFMASMTGVSEFTLTITPPMELAA